MIKIRARLKQEAGIAMVIVILAVVVVTVMGAALVTSAVRDLQSSSSVRRAASALGVAEGGVQHGLVQLKVLGPSVERLSIPVPDKSADGSGQWMNPNDPTIPPIDKGTAEEPGPYVGEVGGTDRYTAYILEIEEVDLAAIPPKRDGVYQIVVTGLDDKSRPQRPGARTVEQFVRVRTLDVPFALFAKDGADFGGNPTILNTSLYTTGDVFWRSKVTVSGEDRFYRDPTTGDPLPAAVHATGVIHRGDKEDGKNGPIHPPPATTGCEFLYDRDVNGTAYVTYDPSTPVWDCSPEAIPPYDNSFFDEDELDALGINKEGPDPDTYEFLKDLAKQSGLFIVHDGNSTLNIDSDDLAGLPPFFVLYVEVTGSGDVGIKTNWGPTGDPDLACSSGAYDGSFGIIVVRDGDLDWQNNDTWWGSVFVPEGEFGGTGAGQAWLVGTVYAKTIGRAGNFRIQLNECWLDQAVGPFFSVSRLRWHESDR